MDDLIEALTIFRKYANEKWPTICEHDILYITGIGLEQISDSDQKRLVELGFDFDRLLFCWYSSRFGSA